MTKLKLSYMGRSGVCTVNGDAYAATVCLPNRLWRLYLAIPDTAGAVLANYVRQACNWPRGEGTATIINFRQKP
jgi:hypothetical protein